jgi:hypothetical protein
MPSLQFGRPAYSKIGLSTAGDPSQRTYRRPNSRRLPSDHRRRTAEHTNNGLDKRSGNGRRTEHRVRSGDRDRTPEHSCYAGWQAPRQQPHAVQGNRWRPTQKYPATLRLDLLECRSNDFDLLFSFGIRSPKSHGTESCPLQSMLGYITHLTQSLWQMLTRCTQRVSPICMSARCYSMSSNRGAADRQRNCQYNLAQEAAVRPKEPHDARAGDFAARPGQAEFAGTLVWRGRAMRKWVVDHKI